MIADIVIVALIAGYGAWVVWHQHRSGHGCSCAGCNGGCSGGCAGCGGSCGGSDHGKTADKNLLHGKG